MNLRLSQDMDSLMNVKQDVVEKATVSSVINYRVVFEYGGKIPSRGNNFGTGRFTCHQVLRDRPCGSKSILTKKVFRSAFDNRGDADPGPYIVTEANDTQQPFLEFLTQRSHSLLMLQRQESNHSFSLDTTSPMPQHDRKLYKTISTGFHAPIQ